jgi:leucyl/phenylalanyl-tRNA---protein transferase
MLPWLTEDDLEFPSSATALREPNGLIAGGGDLSVPRLLAAYKRGIFPWFSPGQPILWWTPDPRTVFYPAQVHCSDSLRRFLRKTAWHLTIDRAFVPVMAACADRRPQSSGTWITASMKHAYKNLHQAGYAHSIEVWEGTELVGGLYGVALGKVFFGESMFSRRTNASKVAVIVLARFLDRNGFQLFDCQVASEHLFSLGATSITRATFEEMLRENTDGATITTLQLLWQSAASQEVSIDGYIRH